MTRRAPRTLAFAVQQLAAELEPATPLAAVQRVWAQVAGSEIAAAATPTAVRDGVVTVSCRAAVWAQELELMGPDVIARVNAALGSEALTRLRCRTTPG
jgi:predicted nucleic acid-binding Zn ribbon protein